LTTLLQELGAEAYAGALEEHRHWPSPASFPQAWAADARGRHLGPCAEQPVGL